jgi:TusE/DsrC/DsvC family sulfur relay protein
MPQTATPTRGPTRLQDLAFDGDGFLMDPTQWNEQVAQAIAAVDGVGPLTPDHWGIIHYMREHHFTYGSLPPTAQACHSHGLDKHAVARLFGGCRCAWRIAGLPNPGAEALSYMS